MTHHIPRGRHASGLSTEERFWLRVEKTDSCWLWRDPSSPALYGRFKVADHSVGAHRFAYELLVGPIPEGMEIDHLCGIRNCVNPKHLEPVSGRVNKLRGKTVNALNAGKTHCVNGHLFDAANTLVRASGGRSCRACHRMTQRRYLLRKAG